MRWNERRVVRSRSQARRLTAQTEVEHVAEQDAARPPVEGGGLVEALRRGASEVDMIADPAAGADAALLRELADRLEAWRDAEQRALDRPKESDPPFQYHASKFLRHLRSLL